jgi:hypothetical protein
LPAEIDWFEEAAKVRREMRRGDPDCKIEWLDNLDKLHRELNENVVRSSCIDNSPVTAFSRVSPALRDDETWVDNVQRTMNDGFDAIHEMLQQEGKLLEERSAILSQMQELLVEHSCDCTADLDTDDEELPSDDEQPLPRVEAKPKTASRQRPRFI